VQPDPIKNNEQPSHGGQELPEQLTQEQFDDEVEIDLAVLLSQGEGGVEAGVEGEQKGEQRGEQERLMKAKEKRMMTRAHPRDMKVLRILTHSHPE
jgi:hypothetical protein